MSGVQPAASAQWPVGARAQVKALLARAQNESSPEGATLLIYHRVGGGTHDELDVAAPSFARHLGMLADHDVVSLDTAMDRLDAGDPTHGVVLTFDDGFEDVYRNAWPLLRDRALPFTVYLATAYMGSRMRWEGSTARGESGKGLSWAQLSEMVESGLCTVGNHTHTHARPEDLTDADLDLCTRHIQHNLGVTPAHFTYPWGIAVPALDPALRSRFRSASTGQIGRNQPGTDPMRLNRVPVRRTDPDSFFQAKLSGTLRPERAYAGLVRTAKALGLSG